ncbi:MAG: hypothetical protein JWN93_1079, partial [Hyphomicrobiales bacterium]|nr:hypothetical protein [Hyphomicrobiales bacterium]
AAGPQSTPARRTVDASGLSPGTASASPAAPALGYAPVR